MRFRFRKDWKFGSVAAIKLTAHRHLIVLL
jgi:hypothetical protein